MESWSGVLVWHVGFKFWSGMVSEFESLLFISLFIIFTVYIHKEN